MHNVPLSYLIYLL